jgi:hypothetical protein
VPLLAKVLFDRDVRPVMSVVPSHEDSQLALAGSADIQDDETTENARDVIAESSARRAARTVWRLAAAFRDLQDLLASRPRGGFVTRSLAKVPVVGVAGGWLDERGGIRKAADETARLIS